LVHIVQYNAVQEHNVPGWGKPWFAGIGQFAGTNYQINAVFTDWSVMAQDSPHIADTYGIGPFNFQDCQFHGGQIVTWDPTFNFTNCLFERVFCDIEPGDTNLPVFRNNLVYGGTFGYGPWYVTNAIVKDNLFDHAAIPDWLGGVGWTYDGGFNGYVANCDRLDPGYSSDVILSNSPAYQTSWFGNYYLPPGSALINAGSTTADQVGLSAFTTQTNQVEEGNSVVDVGFHYVATDSLGMPLVSNGALPDYLPSILQFPKVYVALVSPVAGKVYAAPANINLEAFVYDSVAPVTSLTVSFYWDSTLIQSIPGSELDSCLWPDVPAGTYTLTCTAQDTSGASITSAPVSITVTNLCGSY
jgi:hypothetical protein